MTGWRIGPEPTSYQQRLLSQPFEPERLQTVLHSTDADVEWDLHDGPHPRIEDPDAVGHLLIVRSGDTESRMGGVGARLASNSALGTGFQSWGRDSTFLLVRCAPMVAAVEVVWDVQPPTRLDPTSSPWTGEGWVVLSLRDDQQPRSIRAYDAAGSLLSDEPTARPVARRDVEMP